MAIISSVALGKAQKSVGNVTFQHYYGKTVAKQKVVRNPAYKPTTKQIEQRNRMYYAFKFLNAWDGLTDMLFVRSKWGTKRNNFLKLNYPAISAYSNDQESIILPQSGFNVNLLNLMLTQFTNYNLPVFIAKGVDASINAGLFVIKYEGGASALSGSLHIVDAGFTKVRARLIYFSTAQASPYSGSAPLQVSVWQDLTLTSGTWNAPVFSISVPHEAAETLGYIYQIMIDDTPCTINATGANIAGYSPVGIIDMPIQ